ncbi:MAG: acetolactate synthase small subunit, partial [Desulfovibrio sp.]|nr:acetolactate synthase small subunit [Desulfovibrio sp.]
MQRHVLSVLVENEPGVLSRVAGLFSGRGFNIDSLNVAPALESGVSHMTIEERCHPLNYERVESASLNGG